MWLGDKAFAAILNPLLALPSFLAALRFRDRFISAGAFASLGLIALSGKPDLLIHQYLLPHVFMIAALSIEIAGSGDRKEWR